MGSQTGSEPSDKTWKTEVNSVVRKRRFWTRTEKGNWESPKGTANKSRVRKCKDAVYDHLSLKRNHFSSYCGLTDQYEGNSLIKTQPFLVINTSLLFVSSFHCLVLWRQLQDVGPLVTDVGKELCKNGTESRCVMHCGTVSFFLLILSSDLFWSFLVIILHAFVHVSLVFILFSVF